MVLLLLVSNTFMTFAWYAHLRYRSAPIVAAVLVSWMIALGEYCFHVPANRIGYGQFSGYQLKISQESITLVVFAGFAYWYLGESMRWNYLASFASILAAVMFAFWGRSDGVGEGQSVA
jgi:uncharacterized protein (DUF486 family)